MNRARPCLGLILVLTLSFDLALVACSLTFHKGQVFGQTWPLYLYDTQPSADSIYGCSFVCAEEALQSSCNGFAFNVTSNECLLFDFKTLRNQTNRENAENMTVYTLKEDFQDLECPPDFFSTGDNSCLHFNPERRTWFDAEADCQAKNASLVSCMTPTEEGLVLAGLPEPADPNDDRSRSIWLGVHNFGGGSTPFVNLDGSRFQISNHTSTNYDLWYKDPVQDIPDSDCLKVQDGVYERAACTDKRAYACKWTKEAKCRYNEQLMPCTFGFIYRNGRCYYSPNSSAVTDVTGLKGLQNKCQTDVHPDSYLPEVGSAQEKDGLDHMIHVLRWGLYARAWDVNEYTASVPLGLTNVSPTSAQWLSGSPVTYTNWCTVRWDGTQNVPDTQPKTGTGTALLVEDGYARTSLNIKYAHCWRSIDENSVGTRYLLVCEMDPKR